MNDDDNVIPLHGRLQDTQGDAQKIIDQIVELKDNIDVIVAATLDKEGRWGIRWSGSDLRDVVTAVTLLQVDLMNKINEGQQR